MASKTWAAVATVALAGSVAAVEPYNGCSFWNARLAAASWSCAAFNIEPNACTITDCYGPICVSYPGELFTGYMPDYFIEVTNKAGKSAFTTADAPLMALQMQQAANVWSGAGMWVTDGTADPVGLRTTREHSRAGSQYSFWYGRALPIPYGPLGWTLTTMGFEAGVPAPTCFSAITEFAKETWVDHVTQSGDRALAALWAPLTASACTLGAPVTGAIATLSTAVPAGNVPDFNGCAFNLGAAWQQYMAATGADSYNPAAQCMGTLGGLLPRTGFTDGDEWTAAQRVAWRTASLAQDYWHSGPGVRPGDKWQIIWPRVSGPRCWAPGSLLRPAMADPAVPDPSSLIVRAPGYDTGVSGKPVDEFVFAVWRKRSQCLRPWTAPVTVAEIAAYQAREAALCAGMNAAAGGP